MENAKTLWGEGSIRRVSVVLVMLLAVAGLSACQKEPPEQRLRARLGEMQAAAVEFRPDIFMEGVAEDFTGNDGMDRAALHNFLRAQVLLNARIGATAGPLDVSLNGDRATVRFSLVLTGGSGRLLPEHAQTYRINSGWREEDDEWRLYYAEWEPGI